MKTKEALLKEIQDVEKEILKASVEADGKKIQINGSFGKFGSKWSILYSPELMIGVTLTGQLALLMLIEMVGAAGFQVISANTDGILIYCKKSRIDELNDIIAMWEFLTDFSTEETRYKSYYAKDVNNYIAIKEDGSVKGKGLYANPWEKEGKNIFKLHKNPCTTIVNDAVVGLLRDGISIRDTITKCRDIRKFTAVRKVKGGAQANGEYVGKAVRWYYSTDKSVSLNYVESGNKVPKSTGAKPLMELPELFPSDVDYDWYVEEANIALLNVGYLQMTLF